MSLVVSGKASFARRQFKPHGVLSSGYRRASSPTMRATNACEVLRLPAQKLLAASKLTVNRHLTPIAASYLSVGAGSRPWSSRTASRAEPLTTTVHSSVSTNGTLPCKLKKSSAVLSPDRPALSVQGVRGDRIDGRRTTSYRDDPGCSVVADVLDGHGQVGIVRGRFVRVDLTARDVRPGLGLVLSS